MLSFILGSPGSGKTDEVIRRVKRDLDNEKKVLVIVPEQDILAAERLMSTAIGATPNIMNLEVVSFRRFCNTVFRALGGLCYNYLDKGGQAVIMWRVLSELSGVLNTFRQGASTDIGLVSSLVQLCGEFADYNVHPERLAVVVDTLDREVVPKAMDIAVIYARYDQLIHKGFDSEKDDILKASELLNDSDILNGTNIYIESFSGFTPVEYELIETLMIKSDNLTVTLSVDESRDSEIFENIYSTKKRIITLAEKNGIAVCNDTLLTAERASDLAFFEKYCYDSYSKESYLGKPENISLFCAGDIYTECELVCADIAKQIRGGMRYRDIAVAMGDASAYTGILDSLFERHNIPCHFSVKDDILQKPIVKLIISALNIITYNWRLGDVISYIKTGLCGISVEECDIIEEYASTWSVQGSMWKLESAWNMNPDGYTDHKDISVSEKLVRINEIRDRLREPVLRLTESIDPRSTCDACARALYTFITSTVDLNGMSDADTAAYNALISAFEQLSLCGGELQIGDFETLKKLIRLLTSQTDYSLIPATVDQVNCTSLSALKSSGLKKCYILGAVDGSFPSVYSESNILNVELRSALCARNIILPNDPEELSVSELYAFWKGVLCADSVTVSRYTGSLDGKEVLASPCIYELKRLFPEISEITVSDLDISDLIYDRESAFDRINDPHFGKELQELLKNDKIYTDIIKKLYVPLTTTVCSVNDPENLKVFSGDINLTQSRVDSYVHCSFAYQLDYVLNLNEQRRISYDPRDVGNFIHALLEEFFTYVRDTEKQGNEITDQEIEKIVDALVDAYLERTCGDALKISRRMIALFKRLKRQALVFVHSIYDEFKNSDFKPVLFELPIAKGGDGGISPFRAQLSDGSDVYIYGQIDRVDTYEKDGCVYFRVVDYKTGSKAFKREDLEKGLNLQMFLYMFSIMENKESFCNMADCRGELVPAGVLYYIARLPKSDYDELLSAEDVRNIVIKNIERQGMLLDDDDIISSMSKGEEDTALPKGITTGLKTNSEDSLFTLESLDEIKNTITDTLVRIANGLKTGKADADPMRDSRSPCEYCRMRVICRHNKEGGTDNE
ncbi:MAG: PD-(D/E)XK nuclease family protein [Clostridia bacterium]|nr:PD-(D/E)XK nuclease family protein [Clostridia bacterium]